MWAWVAIGLSFGQNAPQPDARFVDASSQQAASSAIVRPVHTYSIVARDPETGDLGVAVQSHWFSVGPIVPWAESGVGAVATQSLADPAYGPLGLASMRVGRSAPDSLRGLLESDPQRDVRQVAMIDIQGRTAAFTGSGPGEWKGHKCGVNYCAQGNSLAGPAVLDAMVRSFESSSGPLASCSGCPWWSRGAR